MKKPQTTTGKGNCALRLSRLHNFNKDLVEQAFLRDGLLIDLFPVWNNSLFIWEVSATDESGNCEAIASFETEKEGQRFIDGLLLLAEVKGVGDKIKKAENLLPSDCNGEEVCIGDRVKTAIGVFHNVTSIFYDDREDEIYFGLLSVKTSRKSVKTGDQIELA